MLDNQIPAPERSKYIKVRSASEWANPFLVLNNDGTILVTTKSGTTNQRIEDLEAHFLVLPLSDWSFGRVIALQPCALRSGSGEEFKKEDNAIKKTWSILRDITRDLKIEINLWPSA